MENIIILTMVLLFSFGLLSFFPPVPYSVEEKQMLKGRSIFYKIYYKFYGRTKDVEF